MGYKTRVRCIQTGISRMINKLISLCCIVLSMTAVGAALVAAQESPKSTIVGEEIEIFVIGKGADTLIMAAGNGRPAADLADLARRLASDRLRVVTYNYRGIDASKGTVSGITLHHLAGDVWRIADALGVEKVHLAGKTYGNRVMRTASADEPGRTLSVILIGAGGEILPPVEVQEKYKRYVDPDIGKDEWTRLQGELMFAPGNEHLASLSAKHGKYPAVARAQIDASNATPKSEWMSGGSAPMMVLTCLQDVVAVPENALNIGKRRPDTWVVGIPGCGHNMLFEQPDAIAELITSFINRTSRE